MRYLSSEAVVGFLSPRTAVEAIRRPDVVFFDVMDQTIDSLNNDGIELIIDGESTHVDAKAAKSADYTEPVDFRRGARGAGAPGRDP